MKNIFVVCIFLFQCTVAFCQISFDWTLQSLKTVYDIKNILHHKSNALFLVKVIFIAFNGYFLCHFLKNASKDIVNNCVQFLRNFYFNYQYAKQENIIKSMKQSLYSFFKKIKQVRKQTIHTAWPIQSIQVQTNKISDSIQENNQILHQALVELNEAVSKDKINKKTLTQLTRHTHFFSKKSEDILERCGQYEKQKQRSVDSLEGHVWKYVEQPMLVPLLGYDQIYVQQNHIIADNENMMNVCQNMCVLNQTTLKEVIDQQNSTISHLEKIEETFSLVVKSFVKSKKVI